jgi:hypothetical protein
MNFEEWWNQNNAALPGLGEQVQCGKLEMREILRECWNAGAQNILKETVFTGEPICEEKIKAEAKRQKMLLL